jgi:RNA polymerase sigma-70 factor (ECF subfamily)
MASIEELSTAGEGMAGDQSTDRALLRRFRRGSQDAATLLYLRYARRLHQLVKSQCSSDLIRNLDVEDIVQSVFGSFFRRANQGYYDVPDGEDLWGLFLVIALNKIRAKGAFYHAAKRNVRRTVGGEAGEQRLEQTVQPEDEESGFLHLILLDTLERLQPSHRAMVELRIEGYEVAEIAGKVGRSKRTVERLLQEARQQLHGLLHEEI